MPTGLAASLAMAAEPVPPRSSGVTGDLAEMPLVEIVQMLEHGQKSARIELSPKGYTSGEIGFHSGKLVYSRWGSLEGAEAFYQLVACRAGLFRILYGQVPPSANIDLPFSFLMLEAMRRLHDGADDPASLSSSGDLDTDDGLAREEELGGGLSTSLPSMLQERTAPQSIAPPSLPPQAMARNDTLPDGMAVTSGEPSFNEQTLLLEPPGFDCQTEVVRARDEARNGDVQPPQSSSPFDNVLSGLMRVERHATELWRRTQGARAPGDVEPAAEPTPPPARSARRWLLGIALTLPIVVVIVLFFGGSGDVETRLLQRIDGGEAREVLLELSAVPVEQRTGRDELFRGHALAKLEHMDEAVEAYHRAAKAGAADERGLEVLLSRLDREEPSTELDAVIEWRGDTVRARLMELIEDPRWWVRQNAIVVLEGRGEAAEVDREAFAIRDLLTGPTCLDRRKGLLMLGTVGKGPRVREAMQEAARRRTENACMERELRELLPSTETP